MRIIFRFSRFRGGPGSDSFYAGSVESVTGSDLRFRQKREKPAKVFIWIFEVILKTDRIWICKGIKRKRKTDRKQTENRKIVKSFYTDFLGIETDFLGI